MQKLKVYSHFDLDIDMDLEIPCELFLDSIPSSPKKNKRILWVLEPNEISQLREKIIINHEEFDLILTYDDKILSLCKNSKLFLHGTSWIENFDLGQPKQFCVTTLIGGKNFCFGHRMRHEIFEKSEFVTSIPIIFFNSRNFPFQTSKKIQTMESSFSKNELFYSQFHIAIENHSSKNYFTEKIVDCFQTKTIPIYYGCENINDFFDSRGFFVVSSINEIIDVCNKLEPDTYEKMKKYVEINYSESMKYSNYKSRVKKEIEDFLCSIN